MGHCYVHFAFVFTLMKPAWYVHLLLTFTTDDEYDIIYIDKYNGQHSFGRSVPIYFA